MDCLSPTHSKGCYWDTDFEGCFWSIDELCFVASTQDVSWLQCLVSGGAMTQLTISDHRGERLEEKQDELIHPGPPKFAFASRILLGSPKLFLIQKHLNFQHLFISSDLCPQGFGTNGETSTTKLTPVPSFEVQFPT